MVSGRLCPLTHGAALGLGSSHCLFPLAAREVPEACDTGRRVSGRPAELGALHCTEKGEQCQELRLNFLQLCLLQGYHTCIAEKTGTFRAPSCVPLTKLLRMVRPLDISDVTHQKVG